ncbi:hypothetical protein ABIE91_004107 [Bradyrhizobium elkanii]
MPTNSFSVDDFVEFVEMLPQGVALGLVDLSHGNDRTIECSAHVQ